MNFDRLKKLDVKGKTAKYELTELMETPTPFLIVKPAGASNPEFFNAWLAKTGASIQRLSRPGARLSADNAQRTIEAIRELFPKYIVSGWSNVKTNDGDVAPYSESACRELFAALPDWILEGLNAFCNDPSNFVDREPVDIEAVAGN